MVIKCRQEGMMLIDGLESMIPIIRARADIRAKRKISV